MLRTRLAHGALNQAPPPEPSYFERRLIAWAPRGALTSGWGTEQRNKYRSDRGGPAVGRLGTSAQTPEKIAERRVLPLNYRGRGDRRYPHDQRAGKTDGGPRAERSPARSGARAKCSWWEPAVLTGRPRHRGQLPPARPRSAQPRAVGLEPHVCPVDLMPDSSGTKAPRSRRADFGRSYGAAQGGGSRCPGGDVPARPPAR